MTEPAVIDARIRSGHWEATLLLPEEARQGVEVRHEGRALPGIVCVPLPGAPGRWSVSLPIPPELLSDGVQTFLVGLDGSPDVLARFSIVAGAPLEDDLRAEIALLRAELDMMKRAFRQHLRSLGA